MLRERPNSHPWNPKEGEKIGVIAAVWHAVGVVYLMEDVIMTRVRTGRYGVQGT